MYAAAVQAVSPDHLIRRYLGITSGGQIRIGDSLNPVPEAGMYLIAIGKAAIPMAFAAEAILADHLSDGLVVSKSPSPGYSLRSKVMVGGHPIPDHRSIQAGEAMLRFAEAIPAGALVLCLISGGGSSLVETLEEPYELEELQEITKRLLFSGATINELNAVRSRISKIKAGKLLEYLSHTSIHNLIISDVIGDDPRVIASGPTVPSDSNLDVEEILKRAGVEIDLPDRPLSIAMSVQTLIIANVSKAIDVVAQMAIQYGYTPVILTRKLEGEASEVAKMFVAIASDTAACHNSFSNFTCLIAGGETTVTVDGDGVGGRNTEAALAAAIAIRGTNGVTAGFLATDGDDGLSRVAGAIVDGATIQQDSVHEALSSLQNNDSYTFLERVGATVRSGPTETNVNDLWIALIDNSGLMST